MFASFDARTGAAAIERAKQTRTDKGCYPCRAKKKKCDLQRPRCYRCRNSTTVGQVCRWPAEASRSSSTNSSPPAAQTQSVPPTRSSAALSSSPADTPEQSVQLAAPFALDPAAVCQSAAVSDALRMTPLMKAEDLPGRFLIFERHVFGGIPPEGPIVWRWILPLALSRKPLMHALLACSGVPNAHLRPELRSSYLVHYNKAVKGILNALKRLGPRSAEWMQSAILLLHIFEEYQEGDEVLESRKSHIRGAHLVFHETILHRPPATLHSIHLLSAYTYRTCVNALFDPDCGLGFEHINVALSTLTKSGRNLGNAYEVCPWVGTIGFPLCDFIYKLSWMMHACPDADSYPARHFIKAHPSLDQADHMSWNWVLAQDVPAEVRKTRILHIMAARLLMAIWTSNKVEVVQPLAAEAMGILKEMLTSFKVDSLDAWPLTIIGCGCPLELRMQFRDLVASIKEDLSPGVISRTAKFCESAWSTQDILLREASPLLDKAATKMMFF